MALANVAQVVAAADADRAERIVWSITSLRRDFSREKDMALANVAQVVAAADADRAERIIWSITDGEIRVKALVAIARLCLESEEFFERSERLSNA